MVDKNDEEIEEFIDGCSSKEFKDIESTKVIHSNLLVINEILEPLNEAEIFFENPTLKINKTVRNKLQIVIPQNKFINSEDLNIIKDIKYFQKTYEENADETNKTIEKVKNNFIELGKSVKSLIELIEKVKNEYFNTIKQMVTPIIDKIKNIEKFDTKRFDKETLKTFEKKKKELDNKIKSYDKNLANIIKELKEVFNRINKNIKSYLKLMNELDQPINTMIQEIEKIFNEFEDKSKLFVKILIESPEERPKAFELFEDIKKLNKLIIRKINEYETNLYVQEKELKNKKNECSNDFDNIKILNNESSKKLNNLIEDAKEVQKLVNELLEFCSLPQIKGEIKEYKGLQLDEIKKGVVEGTENIIEANKKLEVDITKLKKFVKEKEELINDLITLDLVFIMDITGSMRDHLNFAKEKIISIINLITSNSTMQVNLGFIGYRDDLDTKIYEYLIYPELTKEIEKVKVFISNAQVGGGGNCEDMAGGLNLALNYKWKGRSRFALLIADTPCHGIQYHEVPNFDSHPQGDPRYDVVEIIKNYARKNINLVCLNITQLTVKLYNNFVDYYQKGRKNNNTANIYVDILGSETQKLAEMIVNNAKKFYEKRHETEPIF